MVNTNTNEIQINGLQKLADILAYCDMQTTENIMHGLRKELPQAAAKLSQSIVMFDDLANADEYGMKVLLKAVDLSELATALIGAPDNVVVNFAQNMSKNTVDDLKQEANFRKNSPRTAILKARERILSIAKELIRVNKLYITRPDDAVIY